MPVTVKETKKARGRLEAALCLDAIVPTLSSLKPYNRDLLLLLSKKSHCYFFSFRAPGE